ncbi:alpha/beta hydrolase [Streptomyces apocyni]|uniref:alpha/beta hydrolase n=1 Tax=Streptomyces apocyni TaxID=2654677 RepID=UPI0012EA9FB9|nr:alpha/beta hydrolase [Streptomyces apocyni]
MPHPHSIRAGAAALLTAALLAGCTSGSDDSKDSAPDPKAESGTETAGSTWSTCPAPSVAQGGGKAPGKAWECIDMKAPLDHAKPDGEIIDIAVIRKKATGSAKDRLGSLVFNFGGPGGSGVSTLPLAAEDYRTLNKRYDLVSFDPRGVGESATVDCVDDKEIDEEYASDEGPPRTDAEVREMLADHKESVAQCEKRSGKVLPHVRTTDTARDLDLMRDLLGDDKLNYFGISYGTELGGVYAHLFPKNVGRTVFDAVVDPTQGTVDGSLGQVKGFQLALENYLKSPGPHAYPTSEDIAALLKRLEDDPLPTQDGRELTHGQALTGIAASLYSEESWQYLKQGLTEVKTAGSGNVLLALADYYNGRDDKGRYDNSNEAGAAIRCADSSERFTTADVNKHLAEFQQASPVFGEPLAWGLLGCDSWPVPGEGETPEVSADGAAPIVVIGNTGDPATPYEGARKMADALGDGTGIHVTVNGEGHGTYGVNDCATKLVDQHLLDGKTPADGTTCS